MQTVRLSREELYARVWSEPMRSLAKHYGLSDVGLAKTCKRLRVPVPGRGYWAKKAAGYSVKAKPLPLLQPNQNVTDREVSLEYTPIPSPAAAIPTVLRQQIEFERLADNLIVVSDSLRAAHPLVKQTAAALRERQSERNVFNTTPYVRNYDTQHLDIQASRDVLQRALLIMDALVKGFDERGWKVSLGFPRSADRDKKSYVTILGRQIPFGIREKIKKVENKSQDRWEPKYKDTASGRLSLVVRNSWGYGVERSWDDSPSHLIEDRLNEFAIALFTLAYDALESEARHENADRDRAVLARREAEIAKQRELEIQRLQMLEREAADWERSERLRSYVAAVRLRAMQQPGDLPIAPDLNAWCSWADRHADEIDPMRKRFPELTQPEQKYD